MSLKGFIITVGIVAVILILICNSGLNQGVAQ